MSDCGRDRHDDLKLAKLFLDDGATLLDASENPRTDDDVGPGCNKALHMTLPIQIQAPVLQ